MDFSSIVGAVTGAAEQAGMGGIVNSLAAKVATMAGVDPVTVENLVNSAKEMMASGTAADAIKTKLAPMAESLGVPAPMIDSVISIVMEHLNTPAQA